MRRLISAGATCALMAGAMATESAAKEFSLDPITVIGGQSHPSQEIRNDVDRAFNSSRSASEVNGSIIQNLNPVNKGDAVRYNATGFINQPGSGDRFGGGTKIRTFGDFGASESIDGLPAFKSAGEEGGGYANTVIPSIAVDRIRVLKGGRAVQYGDGTDGGVLETHIKSGRGYKNHQAVSLDVSSASEGILQGEAAHSTEQWDYYAAANSFWGNYNGDPDNLEQQRILGGLGKVGYNFSGDTRAEFLAIHDDSQPSIYRNDEVNDITTRTSIASATLDHRLTDERSVSGGILLTRGRSQWPDRNRDRMIANQIVFADHYYATEFGDGIDYDGSVGGEYKRTENDRDDDWRNTHNDYAFKSRNALTFDDNLVLTGGLRLTHFSNNINYQGVDQPDNLAHDWVWSYQAGASYSVLEQTRVRASLATGYNRYFTKYGNFGDDALNASGAGDEIVESRTIEVGVNQAWTGGYLDIALYNIVQDNVARRNSGAIESVEVNQSGLEIEVHSKISEKVSASAGYMRVLDLTATRSDGTEVNNNIFWDGQTASVPENQFYVRADYRPTEELGLWAAGYYSTGYEAVDADGAVTERDGFIRLDLGTGYWVTPDWALRGRVENLLDERDFGQTVSGAPSTEAANLGRVFWVGTDYTF